MGNETLKEEFLPNVGKVVVEFDTTSVSGGGILMPENVSVSGTRRGKIVKIGPDRVVDEEFTSIPFTTGMTVLADPINAMAKIKLKGFENELFLFRQEDIFGVLR